jgi:hypothetical protein
MATAVFAETLEHSTFDAAYSRKPKFYIELQSGKPKNKKKTTYRKEETTP